MKLGETGSTKCEAEKYTELKFVIIYNLHNIENHV